MESEIKLDLLMNKKFEWRTNWKTVWVSHTLRSWSFLCNLTTFELLSVKKCSNHFDAPMKTQFYIFHKRSVIKKVFAVFICYFQFKSVLKGG